MAAASGRAMLLKIGDGASSETFTTIASSMDLNFTINNTTVDVTTKDSAGQRALLAGGGENSFSCSGNFLLDDSATQDTLLALKNAAALKNFQIVTNSGTYKGAFLVTSLGFTGPKNDAQALSLTLEGSGALTIT